MERIVPVVVLDDETVDRAGLASLLREPPLNVVAAISELDSAVALARKQPVDVVVADVYLEGGRSGLEILRLLDRPTDPNVLFVSAFADSSLAGLIRSRGGSGLVSKSCSPAALRAATLAVAGGRAAFPQRTESSLPQPSERELAVISAVAKGRTNQEIAASLSLSPRTVASHLRRCFARYGVASRTELVMLALDRRWLSASRRPWAGPG